MDIADSFKKFQNKDNIVKLYNVLLNDFYKDEHTMQEYISSSWSHISLYCPISALSIKMIGNHFNMDWKKILALQYLDQIYYDDKLIKMKTKTSKRRQRDEYITSMRAKGHCVGFACEIDNVVMNGQTWDTDCSYSDTSVFEYQNAKAVSHDGILGSAFISRNGYSVTWTSTKSLDCRTDGIPTPIFLFEAMNSNLQNIDEFINFENKFKHNGAHSFLVSNGDKATYLERTNNNINVTNDISLPFSHCNTFVNSSFKNSIHDEFSLKRIKLLTQLLKNKKITKDHALKVISNRKNIWIDNDEDDNSWISISAFVFNPKTYTIEYFDRNKNHSVQ
jgi:hypothetical protein